MQAAAILAEVLSFGALEGTSQRACVGSGGGCGGGKVDDEPQEALIH